MSPRVGVTLSARYRLQRLIATGGMGQVWEGVDSRLGRRVAIKVLKAEYSTDAEFVERFRAEARTVAMLNHPGIAGVYDYGETDIDGEGRTAYLVMELVNGEPLNSVIKRTGRLSLRHALIGGITAAVLWELTRHVLVWYFATLSQIGVVYGSLTTAIAVLLSLDLAATLLLLGAQVISEYERVERVNPSAAPQALRTK